MALKRRGEFYLIDVLEEQIDAIEREPRRLGAEHRHLQLLMSGPAIGWVLGHAQPRKVPLHLDWVGGAPLGG